MPEHAPVTITSVVDQEMVRILDALPLNGESVQRAFDRKEQELRQLFKSLTQAEASELLDNILSNDASPLSRLTPDRRNRLVVCLTAASKARTVQR